MCGIAGIFFRKGVSPDTSSLELALKQLEHRGPDDSGIHCIDQVAIGHTRLSIIDLEGGHQPIISSDENYSLVANGEIYNYVELFEQYRRDGFTFTTASDSETIIPVWKSQGVDGLNQLNGMFAFALYDKKECKLILVRDRMGIKPLYYAALPDRFIFASELKAIVPLLPQQPEVNAVAVNQFMHNQFNADHETVFKGVYRLQPGECLQIDGELDAVSTNYWSALDVVPVAATSFEEASELFDGMMETVMREHIRSDVPFGLFLSGGVDSAVVLAMLNHFNYGHVHSYSIGYHSNELSDELDAAKVMAGRYGTKHRSIKLETSELRSRIPWMIWATDDLMRDYACLPTSIMSEVAANDLKVVFTGEGGDEVFAGYGRYRKSNFQRGLRSIFTPGSGGFRTRSQLRRGRYNQFVKPELLKHSKSFRQPFVNAWQETPSNWSNIQRSQYTDMATALPNNLLLKVDRNTMAFGLEARVPFLDHRIVEFGLSLPDELKVGDHQGKRFLKRWAEKHLPKEHLYRKKLGFHVPAGDILQGLIDEQLEHRLLQSKAVMQWFHEEGVKKLFVAHHRGQNVVREIWSLMHFAIWHKLFIDQPGIRPETEENPLDWV